MEQVIEGFRLSPQQERLWASLRNAAGSWHARAVVALAGDLDGASLRSALQRVVDHHEILRTTFRTLAGRPAPVQVVGDAAVVAWEEAADLDGGDREAVTAELLRRAAGETGRIVTVEEHPVRGGLGGAVAEALGDEHPVPLCILGLPDGGYGAQGPRAELLGRCGLDAAGIAAAARRMLEWRAA
ncbi:MAG TPA: hypothetical protein DD490_07615 [Acidobacteria bacterium]|nr:hypothetical protein [Acidobacteriota bacterium]